MRLWGSIRRSFSTVDASEVRKFENLSWWGTESGDASQALFNMHKTRVGALQGVLRSSPRMSDMTLNKAGGYTALDVGCGGGLLSESLRSELGASKVMGIDANANGIEQATKHAEQRGLDIQYRVSSPEALRKEGERFDLVCALEVVEHTADPGAFLKACTDLCKGVLVVSTINRSALSWILAIGAAEHVAGLVPKGTHDWGKFMRVREIENHVVHENPNRFHTEAVVGLVYNPLTKQWSESRNQLVSSTCNYMYFASTDHST